MASESKDLIRDIIDEYSEILAKIEANVLPLGLKSKGWVQWLCQK